VRIVAPFRPFAAESPAHQKLGAFDWIAALRMQQASARRAGIADCVAISDVATPLPVPALYYPTAERRLMLWILEVCLRYLESADFDRDTAMVSPDILVLGPLARFFTADLGVIVRLGEKFQASGRVLLNSVQFWRPAAQARLVAFYRDALALARTLPESVIVWGADTVPLSRLLAPLQAGRVDRAGLTVSCIPDDQVLAALSGSDIGRLDRGLAPDAPALPLLDFKYTRKRHLAAYVRATVGAEGLA
jgi:hypothetical protein